MKALKREQPDRVPTWELIINEIVIESLYGNIKPLDFDVKT